MGRLHKHIDDVLDEVKEQDRKLNKAKYYHPQLRDEVKEELLAERKRQNKGRKLTHAQQRHLKERLHYIED